MAGIQWNHVSKIYADGEAAVMDFTLEAGDGELVVLAGPSGCGKSTVLRLTAGLEEITRGELLIGDNPANGIAPRDRGVAMVARGSAPFPEMTVSDGVAFGLRLLGVPGDEIGSRVELAARELGLSDLLERKPAELSAGELRRLALARAVARSPKALLLDEPLAGLNAGERARLGKEIVKLQRSLRIPFLYAAEDPEEAAALGDRVVVMKEGIVQQAGSPRRLYDEPENQFVAGFFGFPPMNFIHGAVEKSASGYVFRSGEWEVPIPGDRARDGALEAYAGRAAVLGVRPERVGEAAEASGTGEAPGVFEADVEAAERTGGRVILSLSCGGLRLAASAGPDCAARPGGRIRAALDLSEIRLFDRETGAAILKGKNVSA